MRGFAGQQNNAKGQPPAPQVAAQAVAQDDGSVMAHDLMVELMGAIPTFGNVKVHVGFHGDQAFCSGKLKYVNIPQLPPGKMVPSRIAMEIRGFAAHEAAHLIWTDQDLFQKGLTQAEKDEIAAGGGTSLLREVWNAVEDYMIERNWLLVYPGAHKNFAATEHRCCLGYLAAQSKNPDMSKDLRIVGGSALTWCRSVNFGLKTPLSMDCIKTMPPALQQRVWNWFHDMIDVETTEECLEQARNIVADINAQPFDPNDPPQNQNPPGNPGGQGQGQGQGGQGQGGGAGQGGGGQGAGQGAGQAGGGAQAGGAAGGGSGSGQGAASTALSQGQGQGQAPAPWKVGHSLSDAFQDMGVTPQTAPMNFAVESSISKGPANAVLADVRGTQRTQDLMQTVGPTVGTVSRILHRALQSLSRDRWKGGRMDGLLDDKKLASVIIGAQEVYKKKIQAPEIATAVTVLVDCSGSMNGGELAVCQQLALILQASFSGTPIKFEMLGYTSGCDDSGLPENAKIMIKALRDQGVHADIRSVQLYEFKGFDSPHHVALTTIGNMLNVPMGGTPTGAAVLMAHERLSRRPERRHVMIVLTDGAPEDGRECKKAVKAVEDCGCTVLGMGIGTASVQSCFSDHVVINDARDIGAVVLNKMSDLLFKDRMKVGVKGKTHNASI